MLNVSPELHARVRERGPLTVAAFMDLALYDPRLGYYARAACRTGRAGDFFTSVDTGPVFAELLARQVAEMGRLLSPGEPFDLVEAGCGDGRLAAGLLTALEQQAPELLARTHLHLVEASATARAAQAGALGAFAGLVRSSGSELPATFTGVLVANELLDALPAHRVVRRNGTWFEVYVRARAGGGDRLETCEGPLSTPALAGHFEALRLVPADGCYADVSLAAAAWLRDAAARLRRGFILLFDYGFPAAELYSPARAGGTLTSYRRHTQMDAATPTPAGAVPGWLQAPGEQDLTTHVDFTTLEQTAVAAALDCLGFVDQTYFLLGLVDEHAMMADDRGPAAVRRRLALKTLLLPGGLGSAMKVIAFGRQVGRPSLSGFRHGRVTR